MIDFTGIAEDLVEFDDDDEVEDLEGKDSTWELFVMGRDVEEDADLEVTWVSPIELEPDDPYTELGDGD